MTTEQNAPPEKVSWEAHERVRGERDEARAEADTAKKALQDANLAFEAQEFFAGKVKNPVAAAKMVLPEIRGVEASEDRVARLEAAVPLFAPLEQGTFTGTPSEETPMDVVPDAPPSPSFMRPNPSSDGPAPPETTFTMRSPEVRALVEAGPEGQAEVKKMIDDGRIRMHPANQSARDR